MSFGRTLVTGGSGFIGTNLIEALLDRGAAVLNIDVKKPNIEEHSKYWICANIMNFDEIRRHFEIFNPQFVIHLAANVSDHGKNLDDYRENTIGTMNVVRAVDENQSVSRFVIASTMFVTKAGYVPKDDEDLAPYTVYGESKAAMERMVRAAPPREATWTIVRPTNVWGPWHPRFPEQMWRYLARRWYLHPTTNSNVVRSYAFVDTVVAQMIAALERPRDHVHERTFYLGDEPIPSEVWLDAFSLALTNKRTRRLPFGLLRAVGLFGDLLRLLNIPTPIWSERLRRMSSDYIVPMAPTFEILGRGPLTLEQGVAKSVKWLKGLRLGDF